MSLVPLGRTGMNISRIGVGTTANTGFWGHQDSDASIDAIHEAVDAGINWIDIQEGETERVVGKALTSMPESERPYLFIKCLRRPDGDSSGPEVVDLSPASIRLQVDASLGRLGVDRVDLLQFHWPDPEVPVEDSWGAVKELIDEGKVAFGGLSNFPADLLQRAEDVHHVAAVQQPLSLLDRSMHGPWGTSGGPDVLPWAREHGTGVIIYAPLQHGLLTGAFTVKRATEDLRRAGEILRPMTYWFRDPELSRALELVDALRPIAQRRHTTVGTIALTWVLAWPGVSGAIVGTRRRGQIGDFVDALDLQLNVEDLDEISAAIDRTGVGMGTTGFGPSQPVGVEVSR